MIRLAVIVAAAENDVIGRSNSLPWHLPEDLRYFKRVTMGKPIIMGRKTFESIGRPLPGRSNIVISRSRGYAARGVHLVASLDEAILLARSIAEADGVEEAVVIGGAEIYALALPLADRLYLTRVHSSVEGDAFLPAIDWSCWCQVSSESHSAAGSNPYNYSFVVYERDTASCRGNAEPVLP